MVFIALSLGFFRMDFGFGLLLLALGLDDSLQHAHEVGRVFFSIKVSSRMTSLAIAPARVAGVFLLPLH